MTTADNQSASGSQFVIAEADGGYQVVMDEVAHSWVDLADPTRLEFSYMLRMADYLEFCHPAGERMRVIHIGGAAMTLPRYVAARRPTSPQIVLEPRADLTAAVREKLPLPANSGIKVRAKDGRSGLAEMRADYAKFIIVDAFADARVPADLVSYEFFVLAEKVLHADGVLLLNLIDIRPFVWTERVLAGLAAVFDELILSAEAATLKGRRHGNLVVAASNQELPLDKLTRRAAGSAFPYRLVHGQALTNFIGKAEPFYDSDTQPSPALERGRFFFS